MNSTVAGLTRRFGLPNAIDRVWGPFLPLIGTSVVILAVGLAGCQKKAPPTPEKGTSSSTPAPVPSTPSAPSTPATPAAQPQEDTVLATVNGTNITESQVQKRIDATYGQSLARLAQQSPEQAAQQVKILRQNFANQMINEILLDEQVKQAGIQVTDAEFQAEMTKQLAAQNVTVEQLQKSLADRGIDFQVWKETNLRGMRYDKLAQEKIAGAVNVTDAEVKKYYDENPKDFLLPERVRASHILLSTRPTDPNVDPNQLKVQAKKKAEELLQKAKSGADFAALAKENSEDPGTKAQGGDLGLFPRGQMVKPFEDAAFALQAGEISNIVETQFGYHIIKVVERLAPMPIPFEEAKKSITEDLTEKKRSEAIRAYLESLRKNAKIVFPPGSALAPAPEASQPQIVAPADANSKK